MKWVTSRIVTPVSLMPSISAQVSRRACGSRPVVSSSSTATCGLPTSASAIDSRCFWPPDSLPNLVSRFPDSPSLSISARQSAGVAVERAVQLERLAHAEALGQLAVLKLGPEPLPQLAAVADRVQAEHADRAAVRGAQPFDALDRGGLARTVGAEDPEDLALLRR